MYGTEKNKVWKSTKAAQLRLAFSSNEWPIEIMFVIVNSNF